MKFKRKNKNVEKVLEAELKTTSQSGAQENQAEPKREKQHKVINSLVGSLSHALEEDVLEIDEILGERTQTKTQAKEYYDRERRPVKYKFFLVFGLIVFWLAIIGALSVADTMRTYVYDINNQTALKDEFALFVSPVVMNDPPEFAGTDNLQPSTVIASAIWQIILTGDTSNYERSGDMMYMGTMMTIPEADVEMSARNLFGTGFEIIHNTIDNIASAFVYVPEAKSYIVPENPNYLTYTPRIAGLVKTGDIYKVTVEYIAPSPKFMMGIDYEIEPVKTMLYTIQRRTDKAKTVQSIEFNRITEPDYY